MILKSWSAIVTRVFVCNMDQPRLCLLTRVAKYSSKPSKKVELSKGSFWWLENNSGVKPEYCLRVFFQTFHNRPECIHPIFACIFESLSSLWFLEKALGSVRVISELIPCIQCEPVVQNPLRYVSILSLFIPLLCFQNLIAVLIDIDLKTPGS